MKYQVNQKVTIQPEEWYNTNKQANGFIIFRPGGNKIATFSPGMIKFCGQTFTIGKVVTGSSIYPDHYTFVEDGGSYKWTEEMIAGLASADAPVYVPAASPVKPAPAPAKPVEEKPVKKVEKTSKEKKEAPKATESPKQEPVQKPEPVKTPEMKPEPVPTEQPPVIKPEPIPTELPPVIPTTPASGSPEPTKEIETEENQTWNTLGESEPETTVGKNLKDMPEVPVQSQEPAPVVPEKQSEPVKQPENHPEEMKENKETQQPDGNEITAFESYTILLKPRIGAKLSDCSTQAFAIIKNNDIFPSVTFDFGGFDFTISRRG